MSDTIHFILAGGTILQENKQGKMEWSASIDRLIKATNLEVNYRHSIAYSGLASSLSVSDVFKIRDLIKSDESSQAFIITVGTDILEEVAYALDELLRIDKPVILVAAMRPSDALGYDGIENLRQAILVSEMEEAKSAGVLVVIGDQIHLGRYIHKTDSESIRAFVSHPGPIGDIRNGYPVLYYGVKDQRGSYEFLSADSVIDLKVTALIIHMDTDLSFYDLSNVNGLVLEGMGTGSIPTEIVESLSAEWTSKIPIVIATRCETGSNYNDFLYKGGLEKYEKYGFIVKDFLRLNGLQTRIKLLFELAALRADHKNMTSLQRFKG